MISSTTIFILVLDILLGIAVPVALAIWLVKKYHCRVTTILIGAGVFFLFALVLESLVHYVVLSNTEIQSKIWCYALYGGLMAGLFEETGRFVAMKFLLKKDNNHMALAYGVGHGGFEMIMVFAMGMVSNLVLALMSNAGTIDAIFKEIPADTDAAVMAQIEAANAQLNAIIAQLQTESPTYFLLGLWERVSAMVLQISLSVLVFIAVRKGGRWIWLFPAAILLHALVDIIAVLLYGAVSTVVVEVIIMCLAIAVGAMAVMLYRRTSEKTVLVGE